MRSTMFILSLIFVFCSTLKAGDIDKNYVFDNTLTCDDYEISLSELNTSFKYTLDQAQLSSWFPSTESEPQAVAIVVHGLNNKPVVMDSISDFLSSSGVETLRVSLNGHRGSNTEAYDVTRDIWLKNLMDHYCIAKKRAEILNVPLYFVGYSLGALMMNDLMNSLTEEIPEIEKMVLFAPAVEVKWYTNLVEMFSVFGNRFTIPSATPSEYRALNGTPMSEYKALHHARRMVAATNMANSDIPSLLFIDPEDELVNLSGIEKMIKDKNLQNWKLEIVSNKKSTLKKPYHHLIIDEASAGSSEWARMLEQIRNHLSL